jgi:hypothetical protein
VSWTIGEEYVRGALVASFVDLFIWIMTTMIMMMLLQMMLTMMIMIMAGAGVVDHRGRVRSWCAGSKLRLSLHLDLLSQLRAVGIQVVPLRARQVGVMVMMMMGDDDDDDGGGEVVLVCLTGSGVVDLLSQLRTVGIQVVPLKGWRVCA